MDPLSGYPADQGWLEVNTEQDLTHSDRGTINTTEKDTERRRTSRRRVLKRALIVFQRGHCTIRCQVLNISESGALLMPDDILLCPNEFVLKPDVGKERSCEVVWRKGTRVAVHFV